MTCILNCGSSSHTVRMSYCLDFVVTTPVGGHGAGRQGKLLGCAHEKAEHNNIVRLRASDAALLCGHSLLTVSVSVYPEGAAERCNPRRDGTCHSTEVVSIQMEIDKMIHAVLAHASSSSSSSSI